jgi:glycosyltransferase involved in cell wall biosynthesis
MNNSRVSIVIPCYNYGHYLPQTLESVLRQTYAHWECIVVDDGSTDNTRAVAAHYVRADARFRYFHQANKGPNAARNAGLSQCTGGYLQFLDADDLLEERKLERHVAFLEAHPEADLVYGSARFFTDDHPELRLYSMFPAEGKDEPWMPGVSGKGLSILRPLVQWNIMVNSAALTRMELVRRVGFSDEDLWQAEDWHFWFMCAVKGAAFQFVDLPGTLALIRSHPTSNSKNDWNMRYSEMVLRRKIKPFIPDADLRKQNETSLKHAFTFLKETAVGQVRAGNRQQGARQLERLYRATRNGWLKVLAAAARTGPRWLFEKTLIVEKKGLKRILKNQLHKIGLRPLSSQ